ncbi:MAG: PHP domain-containing protein [Bacteroidales bacterium]|nr:PHP domain-containing protein [Bacteroidales bacterium]
MRHPIFLLAALALALPAAAQTNEDVITSITYEESPVKLQIPDITGFFTLKCDLHTHTVFSDAGLWPTDRVKEAWLHGLDAICISDHIEYTPHHRDGYMTSDLNASYEIAKEFEKTHDIMVIHGAEITRSKPFGHMNAIFIDDAEAMRVSDPVKALQVARSQGAVLMWNHPGWPDAKSTFYPIQDSLIKAGLIDLVEVHNSSETYPVTFDWIDKYNIAPAANSDIHASTEIFYRDDQRPLTLVFAKKRTPESLREALIRKRTAAFFYGKVMASYIWARALFDASLSYKVVNHTADAAVVEFRNNSSIPIYLKESSGQVVYIAPMSTTSTITNPVATHYTVTNYFIGSGKNLEIDLKWRK